MSTATLTPTDARLLDEINAAEDAGLRWDAAKFIADTMTISTPATYEENASVLADSYGITPEAVKNIDRVFNAPLPV